MYTHQAKHILHKSIGMTISILILFYLGEVFQTYSTNLFMHSHYNDVLAGALMVAFINMLSIKNKQYKLTIIKLSHVVLFTLAIGVFWEYIAPLYVKDSVSDPLDLVAYVTGGLIYWIIIKWTWSKKGGLVE